MGPGGRFKSRPLIIVISAETRAALHTNGSRSHWFVLRMRPFLDACSAILHSLGRATVLAKRFCPTRPAVRKPVDAWCWRYAPLLRVFCICSALFCAVTPLPALSSLCNAALPPVHRRWAHNPMFATHETWGMRCLVGTKHRRWPSPWSCDGCDGD